MSSCCPIIVFFFYSCYIMAYKFAQPRGYRKANSHLCLLLAGFLRRCIALWKHVTVEGSGINTTLVPPEFLL